uniref:Deleted in azoospermia-like n=1 Tax=Sphaeramia orbicularis TaxID=375764 RepID=A0A672ZIS5_9TELE
MKTVLHNIIQFKNPSAVFCQYPRNQRRRTQTSPASGMANGFILPKGTVTPNAVFVGGINMKVDVNDLQDLFAQFGSVKEVKIITYRGGVCKGYAFVYFSEDVNIQSIIEQQISFKGRTFKLGPAIVKDRSARMPSNLIGPAPWMNPTQYLYCSCCSPMEGVMAQPSPVLSRDSPYYQPYPYSSFEGIMYPQMLMNYEQNAYSYQNKSNRLLQRGDACDTFKHHMWVEVNLGK